MMRRVRLAAVSQGSEALAFDWDPCYISNALHYFLLSGFVLFSLNPTVSVWWFLQFLWIILLLHWLWIWIELNWICFWSWGVWRWKPSKPHTSSHSAEKRVPFLKWSQKICQTAGYCEASCGITVCPYAFRGPWGDQSIAECRQDDRCPVQGVFKELSSPAPVSEWSFHVDY